jgi:hypothetical protein
MVSAAAVLALVADGRWSSCWMGVWHHDPSAVRTEMLLQGSEGYQLQRSHELMLLHPRR